MVQRLPAARASIVDRDPHRPEQPTLTHHRRLNPAVPTSPDHPAILPETTKQTASDFLALAALAEAAAFVAYDRSPTCRAGLVAAITGEPAMREPWLRSPVTELRRPTTARQT
jgi:hypothetical protein